MKLAQSKTRILSFVENASFFCEEKDNNFVKMPLLENLLRSPSPSFKYISITQLEVHVRMIELTRIQNSRCELSLQFHLMTFSVVWHTIQC